MEKWDPSDARSHWSLFFKLLSPGDFLTCFFPMALLSFSGVLGGFCFF